MSNYHIIRIAGTNKNGEILPDIWVDVERKHMFQTKIGTDEASNQKRNVALQWDDNPDGGAYSSEEKAGPRYHVIKVCDAESETDINNPDEWVPVRVLLQIGLRDSGKLLQKVFPRSEADDRSDARRIVHYDTSIDEDAQDAFDADPNRKAYLIWEEDYEAQRDTKDENQYIEQICSFTYGQTENNFFRSGGRDQNVGVYVGATHPLVIEAKPAKLDKMGNGHIDPPYQLDPFQVIINVSLGGLAVEFFDKAT